jgi:hypothetical protein
MIFGYLDAGSGSLILQAILGGLAGIVVAFKAWKARMMSKKAIAEAETEAAPEAVSDETANALDWVTENKH